MTNSLSEQTPGLRPARIWRGLTQALVGWAAAACAALAAPAGAASEAAFLEADEAFQMSARVLDGRTVELQFKVAEGYYLYRDKIKLSVAEPARLGEAVFPAAERKLDPQFGDTSIYRSELRLPVPVQGSAAGPVTLTVKAQGCADAGLCYPPFTRQATLTLPAGHSGTGGATPAVNQVPAANAEAAPAVDESSRIGAMLGQQSLPLVLASFFGFGLLLALTPCVFPMIPILSGIIVGQGAGITRRRALLMSVAYVLGMAVTYTAAGVAAGLSGTLLSAALQNVWVLGGFALVFVLLSLSMFGFYDLQLPAALQSRLSDSANKRGGSAAGVALMGALSALIVGPCVAAPLAGALLYIAQTGNAALGGAALFAMALGMGAPLLLVGMAAGTMLPRAGAWMEGVKKAFGVMLLGVALWLVSPVLPPLAMMILLAALLLFSGIFLHALDPLPPQASGWRRFWKGAGVMSALAGSALLLGAMAGSRDPLQPLALLAQRGGAGATLAEAALPFERVRSVAELDARLARATRPVMLDFYADWCVSCKEMEHLTFSDPAVRARLAQFELLKADVTDNTEADQALLKRFKLFGPPGILFFSPGASTEAQRVIGFQPAKAFGPVLDRALGEAGNAAQQVAALR